MRDGDPSASVTRGVELILRELDALPTLPAVAGRLLALGASDETDTKEVAAIIQSDPALAARVLSLCNSAAAGVAERVMSVERAVVLLGRDAVRSLALSVQVIEWTRSVRDARKGGDAATGTNNERGFDFEGFWRHSIGVACAAELLCRTARRAGTPAKPGAKPEDAFTAGLLGGIGRLALATILPRAYTKVLDLAERDGRDLSWCERTLLGIDHRVAGKRLAQHWNLPAPLTDVIWLTGVDDSALPGSVDGTLIRLVRAATSACNRLHIGVSGESAVVAATATVEREAAWCGLTAGQAEEALAQLPSAVASRCEALGLGDPTHDDVLLHSVLAANRALGRLNASASEKAQHAEARARALRAVSNFCQRAARTPGLETVVSEIGASAAWLLGSRGGTDADAENELAGAGGRLAAVVQSRRGGPWELVRFDSRGACVSYDVADGLAGPDGRWLDLHEVLHGKAPGLPDGRTALARWARAHAGFAGADEAFWMVGLPIRRPASPGADARHGAGTGSAGGVQHAGDEEREWLVLPAPKAGPEAAAATENDNPCDESGDGLASRGYGPGACDATMVLLREPGGVMRPVDDVSMTSAVSAWSAAFVGAAWWESAARLGEELAQRSRELVAAREQLAEAESFARLGEMAAGAAHEMNNPLTVIMGRGQWLMNNVPTRELRSPARAIVDSAKDLGELIVRLHEVAAPRRPNAESSELAALLNAAVEQARERVRERAAKRSEIARTLAAQSMPPGDQAVIIEADEDLPRATIDVPMCRDALSEVVANALEATGCTDVFVRARVEAGERRLLLTVSDNGAGMDERTLRHAFDPFFSAKPAGRQTGLGLATARRLIKTLGGTIRLHSVSGTGTTAMITLPLTAGEGAGDGQPASVAA